MLATMLSLRRLGWAPLLLVAWFVPLAASERLTSRPRAIALAPAVLAVGTRVTTGAADQRRLLLADRSVLFVRERTSFTVKGEGVLELHQGELFVETASGKLAPTLTIHTPKREIRGRDGRFGVLARSTGTRLVVASGSVRVAGVEKPIQAGQQLDEEADAPSPAPRLAHLVAWTRDLRNAAPLVPASPHAGGTLVALDPEGQEVKLELRRYHIDVHVEDGFARTTIDQTFFNHAEDRLEGTFRFPLPPDASLSRLAMYVDGKRMEGGMAERDHARAVYERIVYERKDPALLEWVDGTTFKMRVFPLEGRQEKRLLLSYVQKLPVLYGSLGYRFPAGHTLGQVRQWSFHARIKNGVAMTWHSESHALTARKDGADLILDATRKDARFDRDVVLQLGDPDAKEDEVRFSRMQHEGSQYLLVRQRPRLATRAGGTSRRDWVVLTETSGDRDPLLMRTQIEVIRALLGNASRDDTFAILTASTRVKATRPVRNDPVALEEAMADLERAHLVGALDLGAALNAARPLLEACENPHLLHVGSGIAAMGEARTADLIGRLPKGTKYLGIGVGHRWNRLLMQTAAEKTGGFFAQVNPDENVAWRGLEIASALDAPRLLDVRVSDPTGKTTFLPFGRLVCQGEEIAAVCRVGKDEELPGKVRLRGWLEGKEVVRDLEVRDVRDGAGYLPRAWAKLEIDRLLAEDAAKYQKTIVDLSRAMYVMTPFTSLLVLENDDAYVQFKVDRGRKDHWATYDAPEKIEVVREPIDGGAGDPRKGIKPSAKVVRQSVIVRGQSRLLRHSQVEGGKPFTEGWLHLAGSPVPFLEDPSFHLPAQAKLQVTNPGVWARRVRLEDRLERLSDARGVSREFLEAQRTHDLTNTDLGISNGTTHSLAIDRIEEISVPGTARFARSSRLLASGSGSLRLWDTETGKSGLDRRSLLLERPRYDGDVAYFHDLLVHAPGLSTSTADLRAVLEAEARPDVASRPGVIAPGARKLFDAARKAGWRSVHLPGRPKETGYTVIFDGADRWSWRRTLPSGLKEQVVCDGKTLWHVYPDLGLASRRTVSRFHRLELAGQVACAVPRPEDLARGADLVLLDERTVAIVPHPPKTEKAGPALQVQVHLVFDRDRLVERRWIEMPAKKLLRKEVCPTTEEASAPGLSPNLANQVVLPLPIRTPDHVLTSLSIRGKAYTELSFAQALPLLLAHVGQGQLDPARTIFRDAFYRREQRQLGYYVLLAATGAALDGDYLDVMEEHPGDPLASYLAVHSSPVLRKHASRWAAASNTWGEGFLRRLGTGHALLQRWSTTRNLGSPAQRIAERRRALAYVEQHPGTHLSWALLGQIQDRTGESREDQGAWAELARAYDTFAHTPGLAASARYETARCLWKAGQVAESRKRFLALHAESLASGRLLRLDGDFRAAFRDAGKDSWGELTRRTARKRIEQGDRPSVLLLAWQCWHLDDRSLSLAICRLALAGREVKSEDHVALHLAGINFLMQTGQYTEAEPLLKTLLDDPEHAKRADLWRVAVKLASEREQPARWLECQERVLALEYAALPEVIDLTQVRREYGELLDQYERLAGSLATLRLPIPAGFRDRVVRTADRWRSLDRDQEQAVRKCASVLRVLGERELAWDYLTTPVALRPGEAEVWTGLASTLSKQGERALADRAYQSAFEREGTNAQILWDRAENLRQGGRNAQAMKLYRQLAESDWQPRFASLREQARWVVEGK